MKRTSAANIALLFFLYLSQGLPFGFQATALPLFMRERGLPLSSIGYIGLLALPWMLKALWAPLVDRFYSETLGRRRSWIIPLQGLLVCLIFLASGFTAVSDLTVLYLLIFLMNLAAATQDIAVDGLAVDILADTQLGAGNAAQVMGFKAGMIASGGLLVWLTASIGWKGLYLAMGCIALLPLLFIIMYREDGEAGETEKRHSLKELLAITVALFRKKSIIWFLLFIMTYKSGEAVMDIMFKPFLIDAGFTASQIGLWLGTWGMVASMAGSFSGGALGTRISVYRLLGIALVLRAIPIALQWGLTLSEPQAWQVIAVTLAEHFFGGLLTISLFAYMMSRVDKRMGATHYTIFASLEAAGKGPWSWSSGLLAENLGYSAAFGLALALTLLVMLLYPLVREKERDEAGTRS